MQFCPSCSYFFLLQLEQKNMGDMKITNAWKKGMAYYENYLCLKKSMRDYENDWYLETIMADYENYLYWKIVWEIMKFIYIWKQKI